MSLDHHIRLEILQQGHQRDRCLAGSQNLRPAAETPGTDRVLRTAAWFSTAPCHCGQVSRITPVSGLQRPGQADSGKDMARIAEGGNQAA